ncbi:hypothetical protein BCR32DRAFT_245397 [Anaeromyces robustus]|uniref:Uncharacterized protein n=1 Tax=Anaeromyces robustus TaxID=1754192 RepID=A0A1Y1X4Z1_9FUNG|nr:hypothetical protein BCR32DRAFT_245397 [Anaeromyces robustus]|eukprot:ORX80772.1 hypothetical protein BCR32DRAFT_245397 [Anaeromyces robustus]
MYTDKGVLDEDRRTNFYKVYWAIQIIIILSSFFYDVTVYIILRKNLFKVAESRFGFFKKFKTISEYRIVFTALVSAIFLPLIAFTFVLRIYYNSKEEYKNVGFDFDELRRVVASIQYYMMFIDQILLSISNKEVSTYNESK